MFHVATVCRSGFVQLRQLGPIRHKQFALYTIQYNTIACSLVAYDRADLKDTVFWSHMAQKSAIYVGYK